MKEINSIIPGSGKILTTAIKPSKTEAGIIVDSDSPYLERQTVVAVGPNNLTEIMVGDIVMLDKKSFQRLKYNPNSVKADVNGNYPVSYEFPVEKIDGNSYLLVNSFSDIKYIVAVNKAHDNALDKTNSQLKVPGTGIVVQ